MAIYSTLLSEHAKLTIDIFLKVSIIKNQIIPLEYIMGFLTLDGEEIDVSIFNIIFKPFYVLLLIKYG